MGRPLKKSFFGSTAANNIKVQFHNGTKSVPGIIVRQKGSAKFLCEDKAGVQALCILVDKAANALAAGEMTISVKLDTGTVDQVTKITAHKITAGGVAYPWNFSASTTDGAAQVEEAGTTVAGPDLVVDTPDDVKLDGATNLEGDSEE